MDRLGVGVGVEDTPGSLNELATLDKLDELATATTAGTSAVELVVYDEEEGVGVGIAVDETAGSLDELAMLDDELDGIATARLA